MYQKTCYNVSLSHDVHGQNMCDINFFQKNDGLTYHTSKNEKNKNNNVYKNKKYKAKLRTMWRNAFTSSYLVLLKEFGPTHCF